MARNPGRPMNKLVALGVVGGGVIGFAVGAAVYLLLNPVLEDAKGWVRETTGGAVEPGSRADSPGCRAWRNVAEPTHGAQVLASAAPTATR